MPGNMQPVATASELAAYHRRDFDSEPLGSGVTLPMDDEPFVACWSAWTEQISDAPGASAFDILSRSLPQLSFPIREGISREPDYRAATLAGRDPSELDAATGLCLEQPQALELHLHATAAGRIPLLIVRRRPEFVALLRALCKRGEPVPVADAQGAQMVAGFNNWARLRALREAWEQTPPEERETESWNEEFARIKPAKDLYQDRFILLSDGPYGAVPAADLGLDTDDWKAMSLVIRREHECAHYLTRRLLGSMKNHALDELLADYAGIATAAGRFRADWFLRCIGLEGDDSGGLRDDGRLHLYRGDPPLSDQAFAQLQRQLRTAARTLEQVDMQVLGRAERTLRRRSLMVLALARSGLRELSAPDGAELLAQHLQEVRSRVHWQEPDDELRTRSRKKPN